MTKKWCFIFGFLSGNLTMFAILLSAGIYFNIK